MNGLINTREAAQLIGVTPASIKNWVKSGMLICSRKGSTFLFEKKEINDFLKRIKLSHSSKLTQRANKLKTKRRFIPQESISTIEEKNLIVAIVDYIVQNKIDVNTAMCLLSYNFLNKKGVLNECLPSCWRDTNTIQHPQISKDYQEWVATIKKEIKEDKVSFLLNCELPSITDVLGVIYQSFMLEGEKAQKGVYYTPSHIVERIVQRVVKPDSIIVDPCCGTGQFLISFAQKIKDPAQIYGVDIDKIAVRIARLNLLIAYIDRSFVPHIYKGDFLLPSSKLLKSLPCHFDVIATNPPWGASYSSFTKERLNAKYLEQESFAMFLRQALSFLKPKGFLSFVLPESILQVNKFSDLRGFLLKNTKIRYIESFGPIFKYVQSRVVAIDIEKTNESFNNSTLIKTQEVKFEQLQQKWSCDKYNSINICITPSDERLIHYIYSQPHTTLAHQAKWALGIVTGDNKRFLHESPLEGRRSIYKGVDVLPYRMKKASLYIDFQPQLYHQIAPLPYYDAPEKLIYRFISNRIVVAYDDQQRLTLNSANIVIPTVQDYSLKVIMALFNTPLYQFLYHKKFGSVKVLRKHLEDFPLPLLSPELIQKLESDIEEVLLYPKERRELEQELLALFCLSEDQKKIISKY